MDFCKNSSVVNFFWHCQLYGYDFQKFSGFMGILFGNFFGFMGGNFYDLNDTTPYLGNSSDPPPPRGEIITLEFGIGVPLLFDF